MLRLTNTVQGRRTMHIDNVMLSSQIEGRRAAAEADAERSERLEVEATSQGLSALCRLLSDQIAVAVQGMPTELAQDLLRSAEQLSRIAAAVPTEPNGDAT